LIFRAGSVDWIPMKRAWAWRLGILLAVAGCGEREKPSGAAASAAAPPPATSSPLTAPVDYLGATAAGKRKAEAVVDLAPLLAALQQFHAAEDRYPARLQELVEAGFLARVPQAPPGKVLSYDPASGMVRLSAGPSTDR
jgi:hypothetical protein